MRTSGRWGVVLLGQAWVAFLAGCPSLAAIGVAGTRDGGVDAAPREGGPRRDAPNEEGDESELDADAPSCTADTESDPKNCGRCRHSCREGSCEKGVCQPYAILTGNAGPYGIAVNNGVVYFTSIDNTVEKCKADSCTDSLVQITNGQQTPRNITTDDTNVYWANEGFVLDGGFTGSIATCGLEGCAGGVATLLATLQDGPLDVAVATSTVYWTNDLGGRVQACSAGGCSSTPTTLTSTMEILSGVAIDSTSVYWTEPKAGNVLRCPLGGCVSPPPFATGQSGLAEVLVVKGVLYWSTDGAIMSCPTSGCATSPTVFAKDQPDAYALATDNTTLYWTLPSPGKVLSCPLTACTEPTLLGSKQASPTAVAVDGTSVYWTNHLGGTVMRVMK
jgi:hypothetical protein